MAEEARSPRLGLKEPGAWGDPTPSAPTREDVFGGLAPLGEVAPFEQSRWAGTLPPGVAALGTRDEWHALLGICLLLVARRGARFGHRSKGLRRMRSVVLLSHHVVSVRRVQ